MAARTGVDYSFSRPNPAALRAAGYTFACRYLSRSPSKNLTLTEADALAAAGLDCVANWEATAGAALLGYGQGAADARAALTQAAALRMPADRPIYFSVDFNATAAQQPQVNAYFDGVASVLGLARTGAYAGYNVISRLFTAGKIRWGWQTYAWSSGNWHPDAHIRQIHNDVPVAGGVVDLDQAQKPDFGQWRPGVSPAALIGVIDMDPNGHDIHPQLTNAQALRDIWDETVGGRPTGDASVSRFKNPNGWAQIMALLQAVAAKTGVDPATLTAIEAAAQAGAQAGATAALQQALPGFIAAVVTALPDSITQAERDALTQAIHNAAEQLAQATA